MTNWDFLPPLAGAAERPSGTAKLRRHPLVWREGYEGQ
jgi:hypothetical protein